jgi:integrase/recombinase XerD
MGKRELPDILTDQEEKSLLDVFNPRYPTSCRNRVMILLALSTGMRVGDIISLQWSDIELDSGRTHVKLGKGKKDRVIFIKPEVLSDMVDLSAKMDRERSGLVFSTLKGKPVQSQYLRRMIGEKAKKAGIEKRVYFHLLRHSYLSKLYGRTMDIRLVQEVAGHSDISTTQIYTHVSGADVKAAMLE